MSTNHTDLGGVPFTSHNPSPFTNGSQETVYNSGVPTSCTTIGGYLVPNK